MLPIHLRICAIIVLLTCQCCYADLPKPYTKIGPLHPPFKVKNKNYEIVVPARVDPRARHVGHAMKHFHSSVDNGTLHLSIPIGGERHHVELRPSRGLVGPGLVIETFRSPTRSDFHIPTSNKHSCHFTGHVRGHRKSRAAISACNGLVGYIQTNSGSFMIEPSYLHDHEPDHPHPHVVYPQSTANDALCFMSNLPDGAETPLKRRRIFERQSASSIDMPEMYVELLVVLDQSLLHYHKDVDIENYVLSIINIAHDLFHDSSLGNSINLAIVRLIRLEIEDHEMNIAVTHNIGKAMQYFTSWQKKINPKDDTHPNHHDMAILMTRIDICSNDKTCGFLGAARYGGMCDLQNQAIIVQDNGLSMGYTLAHELGHTMNLVHDLKPPIMELDMAHIADEIVNTVMSPVISNLAVEWSECSRKRLNDFVEYGFGVCMYDVPTEHNFVLPDALPGVMYDADYQCKEIFGPNAALCMTGLECDNLICYVENKGCIESHIRAAEGSACGENKWCFHGVCVEVGERPQSVQGQWGNWSEWSECTRTCGSGVSSQVRYCNNPTPRHGGKYCDGDATRYRVCSTDPCDVDQPSFRDIQCAEFDAFVYPGDGQVHNWKNYPIHDENPCGLYCVSETGNVASLRPRVIDGTTCYRGIRDICINGMCKEIPCDLDLQSTAVEDRCGVCKGDGSTCDIVRGEHNVICSAEGGSPEKNIMSIPAGAVNVKIEEMVPSETRIQVRDASGTSIFIDGEAMGMYAIHGVKAWVGIIRTKQEAISVMGPLPEKISIWANVAQNTTLSYTYGLPTKTKRKTSFNWDYLEWSTCSAECGTGTQESVPRCVETVSGLVDEIYCKDIPRLKTQMRQCEIAPCVARWFVSDWGECLHCPLGMRSRIVKCYRPIGNGEGELDFIPDYYCASNKPKSSEFCTCRRTKRQETSAAPSSAATEAATTVSAAAEAATTVSAASAAAESSTAAAGATETSGASSAAAADAKATTAAAAGGHEGNATTATEALVTETPMGLVVTTLEPTPEPVTPPKVRTVFDYVKAKFFRLTVHTEMEKGKYPARLPHPKGKNASVFELTGKEALQFINAINLDYANNKTRI